MIAWARLGRRVKSGPLEHLVHPLHVPGIPQLHGNGPGPLEMGSDLARARGRRGGLDLPLVQPLKDDVQDLGDSGPYRRKVGAPFAPLGRGERGPKLDLCGRETVPPKLSSRVEEVERELLMGELARTQPTKSEPEGGTGPDRREP